MEDNKLCLEKQPLSDELLNKMNAYWRAANYLSAGQLYLLDNPLLKKPLTMDQIKKKIVGHWGTVPGQNFIYVHCNRVIKRYDLDMILLSGPGHGGNFMIANTYLEGSYSEIYPNISLGTVYRNLSLLADLGEIQKLSSFGGADRFDARTTPHCHFMCTRCGRVMDVFSEHIDRSLEDIAADFKDGQISDYKARFFGICNDCLSKEDTH